jgi:hypothetical protein
MRIQLADAERAALRVRLHGETLHAVEKRGVEEHGRAHAFRQAVVERRSAKTLLFQYPVLVVIRSRYNSKSSSYQEDPAIRIV